MKPALQARIEALLTARRPHRALGLIQESLASDPGDFDLLLLLAQVRQQLGDLDGGLDACRAALTQRPQNPWGHCRHASLLLDKGRSRPALAAADRALRIDATLGWALHLRVVALLNRVWPRTKAARVTTDRLLALWPDLPASHLSDARVAEIEGNRERAEAAYRRVLEIDPEHGLALQELANLLARSNRRGEAIPLAQAASELELDDPTRRQWARRMVYDGNRLWIPILMVAGPLLVIGIEHDGRFLAAGVAVLALAYLATRWWRRRRVGTEPRTQRFLDRVSQEAWRLKLRVAGLVMTLFIYTVWWGTTTCLAYPDWRSDRWLLAIWVLSSAALATCLHFARDWLRLMPGRAHRPLLWTGASITLFILWAHSVGWWREVWNGLTCGLMLTFALLSAAALVAARLTAGELIRALWWSR